MYIKMLFILRGFEADSIPALLKDKKEFEVRFSKGLQKTHARVVHAWLKCRIYEPRPKKAIGEYFVSTFITPAGRIFSYRTDTDGNEFPLFGQLIYVRQLPPEEMAIYEAEYPSKSRRRDQQDPVSLTALLDRRPEYDFEE